MDARRKQVYTGIYRYENHRLMTVKDQMAVGIEELLSMLNEMGETVTFLGDGVPVFKDIIADKLTVPFSFAPAHLSRQRAGAVGALGVLYYKEGRTETAAEHKPDYLRVSQAERERCPETEKRIRRGKRMILRECLWMIWIRLWRSKRNFFQSPGQKKDF